MKIQLFLYVFCIGSVFANSTVPPGFLWGAATSEYQVSGSSACPHSTWGSFEQEAGRIKEGDLSQEACRHYDCGEEYISALKNLHCNAYRFSIEWSKYEPEEDEYDESVLEHYSQFVDKLLKAGITPMVTLHHFSEPQWFLDKGGFVEEENSKHFIEFAIRVMKKLVGRVSLFITFHEPTTYAVSGYHPHQGGCPTYPPAENDPAHFKAVMNHMMGAHCSVYANAKRLFADFPSLQIGFTHEFFKIDVVDKDSLSSLSLGRYDSIERRYHGPFHFALKDGRITIKNRIIPLKKIVDFIAVNYFTVPLIKDHKLIINEGAEEYKADNDYRCCKEELYRLLMELKYLNLPIYITASGVPDKEDLYRARWIKDHIGAVRRAIDEGVPVRGFFYWSLVDSFEWTSGYSLKFGLYGYDFDKHAMYLREGAKEYTRQIIEASARP